MSVELITFDAADTLFQLKWHRIKFPILMTEKHLGITLDHQVAGEVYGRMLQSSLTQYWELHKQGPEACEEYWTQLTADWLKRVSPRPISDEEQVYLVEKVWEEFYDPDQGWFELFPDVLPTLEEVRNRGYKTAIASNWDYTLLYLVESYGLSEFFDAIYPSLLYGVEKPDRGFFEIIEEEFQLKGDSILHVGDNPLDDFQGALNSGWRALLLDRSLDSSEGPRICSLADVLSRI